MLSYSTCFLFLSSVLVSFSSTPFILLDYLSFCSFQFLFLPPTVFSLFFLIQDSTGLEEAIAFPAIHLSPPLSYAAFPPLLTLFYIYYSSSHPSVILSYPCGTYSTFLKTVTSGLKMHTSCEFCNCHNMWILVSFPS